MIYILGISVVEHMILYSQCTSSASLCLIPSVHRRSGISKSSYLSWLLAVSAFYKAFRTLFRHLFTEAFSVKWLTAFHCSLALHVTQVFPVVLKSFPTSVHMLFLLMLTLFFLMFTRSVTGKLQYPGCLKIFLLRVEIDQHSLSI